MVGLSRDEFAYERRGRVVGEDEYQASIKRRAREILSLGPSGGASPRASALDGGPATLLRGLSRESVLKVIAWTKGQHAAPRQAFYIGRTRDKDDPGRQVALENERGELLQGKAAIQAEIVSWELLADAGNRSAAWRRATPEDRAAMGQAEALTRRQAVHLMFSVPRGASSQVETLRDAVREAMRESFGESGYRYLFAIHTDEPRRPHAHVIVKATSEPIAGGRTRQLRLNPRELEAIRARFSEHAKERGFDITCTRRVDRGETRRAIVVGNEPLRMNQRQGSLRQQSQSRQGSVFEAKAPNWYLQHGLAYERRRLQALTDGSQQARSEKPSRLSGFLGRLSRAVSNAFRPQEGPQASKAPDPPASPSPALVRLERHFAEVHRNPVEARNSFLALYREAPKLAVWAVNNHPQAFGETIGRATRTRITGRGLGKVIFSATVAPTEGDLRAPVQMRETKRSRGAADIAQHNARLRREVTAVARSLTRVADYLSHDTHQSIEEAQIRLIAVGAPRPAIASEKDRRLPVGGGEQESHSIRDHRSISKRGLDR